MTLTITDIQVRDIRFPTSDDLDGSDAMNPDPDYSCAYLTLITDSTQVGHGLSFTLGRGTELIAVAVDSLRRLVVGKTLEGITSDMGGFWREITGDSQLRWMGPDKGVMHFAVGVIVNAVWDLWAKVEGKPLWRLLADMTPEEIVKCIDFRYISDALTAQEALEILEESWPTRDERVQQLCETGFPSYTTSAGWLGYSDEKLRRLCREGVQRGWSHFKIKVGRDIEDDMHRAKLIREEIGWDATIMMDANQVWEVEEAIENMTRLAEFKPWFIEEPTSPDDVLGHAKIAKSLAPLGVGVATGEMCQNRIMFKQLLQAQAITVCQIDSTRVGGVNEILSIILLAKKFGVPVCPHAGGVGLCEYVQHLAMFDFVCVSGTTSGRLIEYVDHLHEHFEHPVVIRDGCYRAPSEPGYSITMKAASLDEFEYPDGPVWKARAEK
jgi:L-fuconate dehydratase